MINKKNNFPIYVKEKSVFSSDDVFLFFDCGDLWIRKNTDFQEDLDFCFNEIVTPSILKFADKEIKEFAWIMKYTAPYLDQIKNLKDNQPYNIIEETEEKYGNEIINNNHNENFIDPITFRNGELTIIADLIFFSPRILIKIINKFKNIKTIRFQITKMWGGFLLEDIEDDQYIKNDLKNPDWITFDLDVHNKDDLEALKEIKKNINNSIKFDLSNFLKDEQEILKKELKI